MSLCSAELGLRNSSTMFFIARNGGSEIKFLGRIPGRNLHLLDLRRRIASDKRRFRWVLGEIAPRLSITSSLYSFVSSGNVIAAAAACGAGSAHAAVTSALAHVAVTAVAIASGACLSTKVDFLWPRVEAQPDSLILDGVNVTGFPIFNEPKVLKAVAFARNAHDGQLRKTGDAYLTHCLHTGRILAALVPATGQRAIDTIVAGILHDVIDDACESLQSIAEEFGEDVAKLVAGVSRLSCINQLLRRRRSSSLNQGALGLEEANNLRVMLLGMVDDPRVVLIKLADRLHNMRTIYALSSPKANAVAQETLSVWCSLASRLGVWALKAELEDLCFAVLQPHTFHQMRAELASMWMENDRLRNMRQIGAKRNERLSLDQNDQVADSEMSMGSEDETIDMKDLLQAVLPFDLLLDRRKRSNFLSSLRKCPLTTQMKPKVVIDACVALASLADIEETLERELFISTSYVPGMEVTLSSRLKSLYSIFCKMKRKHVDIRHVYDARALRVVVGDKDGSLHGAAVRSCYSLLNTVHRLWTPIDGEFDDYIVNPKPSGYQSLHTAVKGPDGSPVEVQIRTERMHKYAEDGLAAHWLYKEGENKVQQGSSLPYSKTVQSAYKSKMLDDESSGEDEFQKFGSLKVGHPLLRVDGSHLLAAVTVRVDNGGRELLVAVSFELGASEAVADRRSFQMKRWEAYASLYKKVSDQWWFAPGHGDWCTCLEKYVLCKDGIYHKQDQFQRLLPTFIQVIDLTEREEADYWMVVSAVFEGKQIKSVPSNSSFLNRPSSHSCSLSPTEANINNKVLLLRTMLQWEEQVLSEAGLTTVNNEVKLNKRNNSTALGEVVIVCWPHGEIMRIKAGSTAADAARRVGLEGKLVLVNGQFTLPHTELKDGDIVEFRV